MQNRPLLDVPKLSEDEMKQLQSLLIRYFAYHAAGLANVVIDNLLSRFRKVPLVIEHSAPEPSPRPKRRRLPKSP